MIWYFIDETRCSSPGFPFCRRPPSVGPRLVLNGFWLVIPLGQHSSGLYAGGETWTRSGWRAVSLARGGNFVVQLGTTRRPSRVVRVVLRLPWFPEGWAGLEERLPLG